MLSLPLAKLSTAQDDSSDAKQLSWSHESHDLAIVLDNFGARCSPSQLLKVVQGTQVLHLVEIERLIGDGNELIRTMQEHGVELKSEQLPISALVRCPLLAIRWQLPNQKIRRIQLRFRKSEDFDTTYNHLRQLGLRMSPANENPSRASTPGPARVSASHLPISTNSRAQGGTASFTASKIAERAGRPYTALTAPTDLEAQVLEATKARPMSAHARQPFDLNISPMSLTDPLNPPEYFVRPDSATFATVADSLSETTFLPPRSRQSHSAETFDHSSKDRPDTALLYDRPDTADAPLPPRRELPFARSSRTLSSGSDRPSSLPSTGLMGPPPLPARVNTLRPNSNRANDQATQLPAMPKSTMLDMSSKQPSWMQQAPRTPNQEEITLQSSQTMYHADRKTQPASSTSPASSSLLYRLDSPSAVPLTHQLSSPSAVAQSRHRIDAQSPLSTPPALEVHQYRTVAESTPAALPVNESDALAAYAMQSEEGRRAALNGFIFQCLEDDNFITLVEDMETCYARIGLGMK